MTQTIRRANLLSLYDQFQAKAQAQAPAGSTLLGVDKAFAAQLQIAASSLVGLKKGGRPIGDKVARQIESNCGLDVGWLDVDRTEGTEQLTADAFLKLASRAYTRANKEERKQLVHVLTMSLGKK